MEVSQMKRKLVYVAMAVILFSAALVIAEVPKRPGVMLKQNNHGEGKHVAMGSGLGKGNLAKGKAGFGNSHRGAPGTPTPTPTPTPMPSASPTSNFGNNSTEAERGDPK